jgi:hypothetical protein
VTEASRKDSRRQSPAPSTGLDRVPPRLGFQIDDSPSQNALQWRPARRRRQVPDFGLRRLQRTHLGAAVYANETFYLSLGRYE